MNNKVGPGQWVRWEAYPLLLHNAVGIPYVVIPPCFLLPAPCIELSTVKCIYVGGLGKDGAGVTAVSRTQATCMTWAA